MASYNLGRCDLTKIPSSKTWALCGLASETYGMRCSPNCCTRSTVVHLLKIALVKEASMHGSLCLGCMEASVQVGCSPAQQAISGMVFEGY